MWRQCFLDILLHDVGVRGGFAHSVASILECDDVVVTYGGCSVVRVSQGIPEGGKLGPFGYAMVPDSLAKALHTHRYGVGQDICVPVCCRGFIWRGFGFPVQELVDKLVIALESGEPLPSVQLLARNPALDASALRAMGSCAKDRLPIVLHADDPCLLASSRGVM